MIYFTADFHFGDPRQKILGRPFQSSDQCIETILRNFNEVLTNSDKVYVLGDCVTDNSYLELMSYIPGRKTLIRGNYDTLPKQEYEPYFVNVIDDYLDLEIGKLDCRLHHYPTLHSVDYRFSLCGHIHGAWKVQKNMLNVGVDVHHFYPVSEEQVLFYFKAISEFYDDDVWCADHESNTENFLRGKMGTYYKK